MEDTMSRRHLVLTRPVARSVAPRHVNHVDTAEPAAQANISPLAAEALPQPEPIVQPQFSKLTPIYKATPVNTVDAIQTPRVKGIEFIKAQTKPKPAPASQRQEATVAPIVSLAETEDDPAASVLNYFETHLDSIDLDIVANNVAQPTAETLLFGESAQLIEAQPINFVEQYFNRTNNEEAKKHHIRTVVPRLKHHLKKVNRKHVRRAGVLSILTGVIAFGGYVTADSFLINQEAKAVLGQGTTVVTSPNLTETATPSNEASQTTASQASAPAVAPISTTASNAAGFTAPSDQPKYLSIKKLGIHAPVVSLGLTSAGAIDTPKNIWDAAWYNGSAKPGAQGAALIDGHSSATRGALFGNLDRLVAGDQIQIERGDGTLVTYSVAYTTIVNRNNVDMASMLKPYGAADKGLNMITCTGKWIDAEKTLENRVLIYAQQI